MAALTRACACCRPFLTPLPLPSRLPWTLHTASTAPFTSSALLTSESSSRPTQHHASKARSARPHRRSETGDSGFASPRNGSQGARFPFGSSNRAGGGGGGSGERAGEDRRGPARDRDRQPSGSGFGIKRPGAQDRRDSGLRPRKGGNAPRDSGSTFAFKPSIRSRERDSQGPKAQRGPLDSVDAGEDISPVAEETDRDRARPFARPGREGRDGKEEKRASRSYRALLESGGEELLLPSRKGKSRGKEHPPAFAPTRRSLGEKKARQESKAEKEVYIPSTVTVGRLADIFGVKLFNLQTRMMRLGMSEDQRRSDFMMSSEEACNIALEYGFNPVVDDERSFDIYPDPEPASDIVQPLRPPVVTIMGHVDHGKTTLLDSLRNTSVAAGEAGGITQHIGAFSIPLSTLLPGAIEGTITFLDTPGHAAFTAMRARGASVTDIVVLVVAADDGVMPQTKEVIELVKSEGDKVGMVVAINKCDKPSIDVAKVKSALGAEGILLEEDGGEVPSVRVSGLAKLGLDDLVETLATLAEIRDLRARKDGKAEGFVLESRVDKGRGNVATVLVSKGTLKSGSCIVAGTTWARVRQMQDDKGKPLREAGPGTPVSVTGWKELPSAGDQLLEAVNGEDEAKRCITNRLREIERKRMMADVEQINVKRAEERRVHEAEAAELQKVKEDGGDVRAFLNERERRAEGGSGAGTGSGAGVDENGAGKKELLLLIKGDVSGTVEAVVGSLEGIGNKEAGVKIIHTGVGEVSESDIHQAEASGATVIGFSVACPRSIQTLATSLSVPLHLDSVIYRLIDAVRSKVAALLPPIKETRVTGEATCAQIFEIKLKGKEVMRVAGCKVGNGVVGRHDGVRVLRGKEREQVYEGTIETLKHVKKDVTEVRKGTECGISFHGWNDIREGDEVVTFTTFDVPREL